MWNCPDNQDVGLEAAIIERVRNSSLVKWFCAENVTGLKSVTEASDCQVFYLDIYRRFAAIPAREEAPDGRQM